MCIVSFKIKVVSRYVGETHSQTPTSNRGEEILPFNRKKPQAGPGSLEKIFHLMAHWVKKNRKGGKEDKQTTSSSFMQTQ